jgi:hypothetical protein
MRGLYISDSHAQLCGLQKPLVLCHLLALNDVLRPLDRLCSRSGFGASVQSRVTSDLTQCRHQ